MDRTLLLAFVAAGRRLALPLNDVERVVPLPLLAVPTGAPNFIEGFFDFHGALVAVVSVGRLLGLGDERLGVYSPLLVLRGQDPPVALHVASITSILKLTAADIQPIGKDETFNACVVGRVGDRGETVYVLSTQEILLAEERAKIASQRAIKRRRLDALAGEPTGASAHAS
ncbi:MAG: chemotaxis protein CheW [Bauldia sp.]